MANAKSLDLTHEDLARLANDPHPKVRMKIAKRTDVPAIILNTFVNDTEHNIRIALTQNRSVSANILHSLSFDLSKNVLAAVARHKNTQRETLVSLSKHADPLVLQAIAKNWNVPFSVLNVLGSHKSEAVRVTVAKNIKTPKSILLRLAESHNSESVHRALLKKGYYYQELHLKLIKSPFEYIRKLAYEYLLKSEHFEAKHEIVEEMSRDKYVYTRAKAATSEFVSEITLLRLANDDDSSVRWQAALNKALPLRELERLSCDENSSVRSSVPKNANVTPELLTSLSFDENDFVRRAVAKNKETPIDVLKKFVIDPNPFVRINTIENKALSTNWLKDNFPKQFLSEHATRMMGARDLPPTSVMLAMRPETPVDELIALSNWSCDLDSLRTEIGDDYEKFGYTSKSLKSLAHRKEMDVLYYLLGNPSLPISTFNKICRRVLDIVKPHLDHRVSSLLWKISQHPHVKSDILDEIWTLSDSRLNASIASKSNASSNSLSELAKDKTNYIRVIVARNPSTPMSALIALARDSDFIVKFGLIQREKIPAEVAEILLSDTVMAEVYSERLEGGYYPRIKRS